MPGARILACNYGITGNCVIIVASSSKIDLFNCVNLGELVKLNSNINAGYS